MIPPTKQLFLGSHQLNNPKPLYVFSDLIKHGQTIATRKTQHIPTLLAQHLQAPAKRSQHFSTTYRKIVGCNMLRAFGQPVATCCDMLGMKIELVFMPGCSIVVQSWSNDYNIMQHREMLHEKFDHFQIWANNTQHIATPRNTSQHLSTGWPNAPYNVAICCIEMLQSFGRGFTSDACLEILVLPEGDNWAYEPWFQSCSKNTTYKLSYFVLSLRFCRSRKLPTNSKERQQNHLWNTAVVANNNTENRCCRKICTYAFSTGNVSST